LRTGRRKVIVILLDKLLELKTKMQGKAHDDLDETLG